MIETAFELGKRLNIPRLKKLQASEALSKHLNRKDDIPHFLFSTIVHNNIMLTKEEQEVMFYITAQNQGWENVALSVLAGSTHYQKH